MSEIHISDPTIAPLRPSCKLVYLVLDLHGPCTPSEVRVRTQLPDSTARDALDDLVDEGLAEKTRASSDPRKVEYDIRAK